MTDCDCDCGKCKGGINIDFGGIGFALMIIAIVIGMAIHDWMLAGYPKLWC
jgi:hypothetical protein